MCSPAKKAPAFLRQTAVIFDWDDTLLASSALCAAGINLQTTEIPKEMKQQFALLEQQVIKLLQRAWDFGAQIFIITNAECGWVELSAQKFMPKVGALLERIAVLSARSCYQNFFPDNPNQWKATAFTDKICATFSKESEVNLISFGDSECERNALLSVGRVCTSARAKSIKFVERPSIEQLRRQLEMICNNFQFIVQHDGPLDLMLTISTCPTTAAPSAPAAQA